VRGVSAIFLATIEIFEPPLLNADWREELLNGEAVVWYAGNIFAYERSVIEPVRGVS
jgi:hypothetical protein